MHIFTSTYLGIIDNVFGGEAKLEILGTEVCPGTSIYYLWKPNVVDAKWELGILGTEVTM